MPQFINISTFGRTFVAAPDAPAAKTILGMGTAADADSSDFDPAGAAVAALASANEYTDSQIQGLAAVASSGAYSDLSGRPTLGTAAAQDSSAFDAAGLAAAALITSEGYTDAIAATLVPNTRTVNGHALSANVTVTKGDIGLGSVDNTSDVDKPVSTATQAAIDAAVTGLFDLKGGTDCSANPDYPAALKGDAYVVTVAGKIGGASGTTVEVGDLFFSTADNAGGTEAAVGASWDTVQRNLVGALLSSSNLSDLTSASAARDNLGLGTLATQSDVTSALLNADVFSTAHTWTGQQTFVAPAMGTPASGVATNLTGTAAGLTAGNVTTNANLTGPITSVGNATSVASQTGTGTTFVMSTGPTLTGTLSGASASFTGQVLAKVGDSTSPGFGFVARTSTGFYESDSEGVVAVFSGTKSIAFGPAYSHMGTGQLRFGASFTAADVAIQRNAANVLEVNTGVVGTFGSLKLASLTATGTVTVPVGSSGSPSLLFAAGNGFYGISSGTSWGFAEGGQVCLVNGAANGGIPYLQIGGVGPTLRSLSGVLTLDGTTGGGTTWGAISCGQPAVGTVGLTVNGIASRTVPLVQLKTSAGGLLGNVGGTIFTDYTDAGNTSTDGTTYDDLYTHTLVANTFQNNGDTVRFRVALFANTTGNVGYKVVFAGTTVFTGTAVLPNNVVVEIEGTLIRESSTVVRAVVGGTYTRVTGLTLTGTNILKVTGTSNTAANDIVAKAQYIDRGEAA